ncbi:hypothetical protein ACFX13_015981 [Malus domestica]
MSSNGQYCGFIRPVSSHLSLPNQFPGSIPSAGGNILGLQLDPWRRVLRALVVIKLSAAYDSTTLEKKLCSLFVHLVLQEAQETQ